jgi:hypothetical protein
MRLLRHSFAGFVVMCCALGACSSDAKPAAVASTTSVGQSTSDTSGSSGAVGGETTPPAASGGSVDCAALKTNLAGILINWQVVLGLSNVAATEWASTPIGSIGKFGDELAAVNAALGGEADAAASLTYMSGANDIVVRGVGGDSTAQADLTKYLGTDISANISKQIPLATAEEKVGCV